MIDSRCATTLEPIALSAPLVVAVTTDPTRLEISPPIANRELQARLGMTTRQHRITTPILSQPMTLTTPLIRLATLDRDCG